MAKMSKSELEARELLRLTLTFLDGGSECDYCDEPLKAPHAKDCIVPRIEKLIDRKLVDRGPVDERTAKCEHDMDGMCDYCLIAFGAKHS